MQAPLGLAVIGGLVMSTFATLLVLPSIFAVTVGRRLYRSPSIYPDDRESVHYDPNVFAHEVDHGEGAEGHPVAVDPYDVVASHTDDEIAGFLQSMLHEIRAKRHEMVTHHSPDDLLDTLGFGQKGPADGGTATEMGPSGTREPGSPGDASGQDSGKDGH